MIKKFRQYFENKDSNHLKPISFFKEYFQNIIDDGYQIKISEMSYVAPGEFGDPLIFKASKYPKKGFSPKYELYLDYHGSEFINGYSEGQSYKSGDYVIMTQPKHIPNYIKYLSMFHECYNSLISDNIELKSVEMQIIGQYTYPTFRFGVVDLEDVPEEETQKDIMVELYDKVGQIIKWNNKMNYEIEGDKVVLTGDLHTNTYKKLINDIDSTLQYSKDHGTSKYASLFFEYKVINQKPCRIEFFNPQYNKNSIYYKNPDAD